jgi:hypothetical protein
MLVNIKSVVVHSYNGEESTVYKVISRRLSQCSFLFSLLAKRSKPSAAPSPALYVSSSEVYYKVSAFLYPDSLGNLESDIAKATFFEEIKNITEDNKKTLYFAHNCQDLAAPEIYTVTLAITELVLQPNKQ